MAAKNEGIEFIDETERQAFARARLGSDVVDFLHSSSGRYLHGRAKLQIEQAREDALNCNPYTPWGRRKWKKIQHDAAVARAFVQWCADAIVDGNHAEQELNQKG
jgi:hypothetical protein